MNNACVLFLSSKDILLRKRIPLEFAYLLRAKQDCSDPYSSKMSSNEVPSVFTSPGFAGTFEPPVAANSVSADFPGVWTQVDPAGEVLICMDMDVEADGSNPNGFPKLEPKTEKDNYHEMPLEWLKQECSTRRLGSSNDMYQLITWLRMSDWARADRARATSTGSAPVPTTMLPAAGGMFPQLFRVGGDVSREPMTDKQKENAQKAYAEYYEKRVRFNGLVDQVELLPLAVNYLSNTVKKWSVLLKHVKLQVCAATSLSIGQTILAYMVRRRGPGRKSPAQALKDRQQEKSHEKAQLRISKQEEKVQEMRLKEEAKQAKIAEKKAADDLKLAEKQAKAQAKAEALVEKQKLALAKAEAKAVAKAKSAARLAAAKAASTAV